MRRSQAVLGLILLLLVAGHVFGQPAQAEHELLRLGEVAADAAADAVDGTTEQTAAADPPAEVAVSPAQPAQPDLPPGTMRFHLMDGSVITGTLAVNTIPIQTEFGDLVVPIESIERFAPGLQSHPELAKTIGTLIEQLGAPDAGRRDAAQSQLISYGPGLIEELRKHRDTDDAERKLRIESVIESLYEQQMDPMMMGGSRNGPSASLVQLDEIKTEAFTMAGQITQADFEIRSKFGTLKVTLGDIMAAEKIVTTKPDIRRSIEITGNDFAGMSWKNTGIRLNRGDRVIIQAEGQIVLSPWGRNTVSGPDGMPNNGMYNGNIPFGALCGKVGDGGEEMMIGSRKNFVAQRAGVLNLGFAMQSNWANQNFPGTYNVRIRVIPGGQE